MMGNVVFVCENDLYCKKDDGKVIDDVIHFLQRFLYSVRVIKRKERTLMQEVKIKDNELEIPIYFADKPNFNLIPDSAINLLMQDLEIEIVAFIEKKLARQKYRNKKKVDADGTGDTHPP